MCRLTKLVNLLPKLKENNISLMLVQINEAHTKKWPLGMNDHPDEQKTFEDRINRANEFITLYPSFSEYIYIDNWNNDFENTFKAWPDKYYFINDKYEVLNMSEYDLNAVVINDYTDLLNEFISSN